MSLKAESSSNGVIVIPCDDQPAENIIQNILGVEAIPEASSVENNGIKGYEWKIETKYYSAVATVFAIQEKRGLENDFAETIQATIFFFNGKEPSSFDNVVSWMPLLKSVTSEVQLLVCENCSYEEPHKKNILNWCVENQFELIELQVTDESDEEGENIIPKAKGYGRVIEALQTCTWSNMILKKGSKDTNVTKDEIGSNCEGACSEASLKCEDSTKKVKVDNEEVMLEEQWLQKVLEQGDTGEESFEALFTKFASMKEKASGLNGEDRKKYAEKVAIAFCRAMGCEEEIEGLDDDL